MSADCTYFSGVATNVTIIPYNPLEHKYRHLPLTLIDAMHSHLKLCVSTDWNLLYLFGCLLRAASFLKCSLALAGTGTLPRLAGSARKSHSRRTQATRDRCVFRQQQ